MVVRVDDAVAVEVRGVDEARIAALEAEQQGEAPAVAAAAIAVEVDAGVALRVALGAQAPRVGRQPARAGEVRAPVTVVVAPVRTDVDRAAGRSRDAEREQRRRDAR